MHHSPTSPTYLAADHSILLAPTMSPDKYTTVDYQVSLAAGLWMWNDLAEKVFWSGVFNLLKFDHTPKKKKKEEEMSAKLPSATKK